MDRLTANPSDPLAAEPATPPAETLLESRVDPDVEAVIDRYFETFNAGNFEATAALFAPEGALCPPFETAVVGQKAIAAYLKQEAEGMQIELRQCVQETATSDQTATDETAVKVAGKVQTPLFGVNVTWAFRLNNSREIISVRIKLLAALEDLLKLKS